MKFFEDVDWHYVVFLVFVVAMIGMIVFAFAQPKEYYELTGIVMDKEYTPARSWTTYNTTCDDEGNCRITTNYHHESEHYDLLLMVNDSVSSYGVSSEKYALTSVGDKIVLSCSRGKIVKIEFCGVNQ